VVIERVLEGMNPKIKRLEVVERLERVIGMKRQKNE
jgi:hypothetical protein